MTKRQVRDECGCAQMPERIIWQSLEQHDRVSVFFSHTISIWNRICFRGLALNARLRFCSGMAQCNNVNRSSESESVKHNLSDLISVSARAFFLSHFHSLLQQMHSDARAHATELEKSLMVNYDKTEKKPVILRRPINRLTKVHILSVVFSLPVV